MKLSSLNGVVLLCLFAFLACGRDNAVEPEDQDKIVTVSFSIAEGSSSFYGMETATFAIDPRNYILPNSNVLHLIGSSLNWPRTNGDLVFNVNKHAELSLVPMYVFRAESSVYQANCARMFDKLSWTAGEGFLENHFVLC